MERARILNLFLDSLLLFPVFLYAETHYQFRYFFSFLKKKEPEVVIDTPLRLKSGNRLPILILIKDAHLFPVELKNVSIIIKSNKNILRNDILFNSSTFINQKIWWRIFEVDTKDLSGLIEFDVSFTINNNKRDIEYHNDNYRTSSHTPLKTYISTNSLPRFHNLYLGECHSHSSYTDDQVEFGAPLEASAKLSKAMELSFFCVTDHSYDLDDKIDDYLENDLELPKWNRLQNEVSEINSKETDFAIIRGEEVTCRNSNEQNVHLLLLGNKKFYFGSGDSAEKWFNVYSENSIHDVLTDLEDKVVSISAHPKESISILQRLLLGRCIWSEEDFQSQRLSGIQFANGITSNAFWKGRQQWITSLLQGRKLYALAGNDAHGNFNRFRQIGIPFFSIKESENQLFGKMRTGVYAEKLSEDALLNAIKLGNTILTDGPVINLLINNKNEITAIGNTYYGKEFKVECKILSSEEYGLIQSLKIYLGLIGGTESILISENNVAQYEFIKTMSIKVEKACYMRAEVWSCSNDSYDNKPHFSYTNPIWFNPY